MQHRLKLKYSLLFSNYFASRGLSPKANLMREMQTFSEAEWENKLKGKVILWCLLGAGDWQDLGGSHSAQCMFRDHFPFSYCFEVWLGDLLGPDCSEISHAVSLKLGEIFSFQFKERGKASYGDCDFKNNFYQKKDKQELISVLKGIKAVCWSKTAKNATTLLMRLTLHMFFWVTVCG